jgi:hypothetical protein
MSTSKKTSRTLVVFGFSASDLSNFTFQNAFISAFLFQFSNDILSRKIKVNAKVFLCLHYCRGSEKIKCCLQSEPNKPMNSSPVALLSAKVKRIFAGIGLSVNQSFYVVLSRLYNWCEPCLTALHQSVSDVQCANPA